jgi:hypothetical protein
MRLDGDSIFNIQGGFFHLKTETIGSYICHGRKLHCTTRLHLEPTIITSVYNEDKLGRRCRVRMTVNRVNIG